MITNAQTPRWTSVEHTAIELLATHSKYGEIPFTASASDPEAHGRDLYARAVAGEFGPVAEYVAPVKSPQQLRAEAKAARTDAVAAITVTTSTGKTFDGDETSQTRMVRAIIGMQAASIGTISWTLANNQSVTVTVAELTEALILAGQQQSAVWSISI